MPSQKTFEEKFGPWRNYYNETVINEVISPNEAMKLLIEKQIPTTKDEKSE